MAHTFTNLLTHIIFSTKNRAPFLTPETRPRLFASMGGIIRDHKAIPILLNGPEDHIHILTTLPATTPLSDFMRELKSVSSGWFNDTFSPKQKFAWQTGYAAFSVSKSATEDLRRYIANQEEHHKKTSFQEEYLAFLQRHEINYDPRFVFD